MILDQWSLCSEIYALIIVVIPATNALSETPFSELQEPPEVNIDSTADTKS